MAEVWRTGGRKKRPEEKAGLGKRRQRRAAGAAFEGGGCRRERGREGVWAGRSGVISAVGGRDGVSVIEAVGRRRTGIRAPGGAFC